MQHWQRQSNQAYVPVEAELESAYHTIAHFRMLTRSCWMPLREMRLSRVSIEDGQALLPSINPRPFSPAAIAASGTDVRASEESPTGPVIH